MQFFANMVGTSAAQVPLVQPRQAQPWPQGHNPLRGVVPCAECAPISCARSQDLNRDPKVNEQKSTGSRTTDFFQIPETRVWTGVGRVLDQLGLEGGAR